MYIKSIELSNFRNYKELSMEFHPEKNILYGDNAQGKTNILEALYFMWHDKIPQRKQRKRDYPYEMRKRHTYGCM